MAKSILLSKFLQLIFSYMIKDDFNTAQSILQKNANKLSPSVKKDVLNSFNNIELYIKRMKQIIKDTENK